MSTHAKRLAPKSKTLIQLALKSGNRCAFPGCHARLITPDDVFVGQLCHIEAAEPGGPRFNPAMTNEERRAADNLMYMCYPPHRETDDEAKYPVSKLQEMKALHELRHSKPSPELLEWFRSPSRTAVTLASMSAGTMAGAIFKPLWDVFRASAEKPEQSRAEKEARAKHTGVEETLQRLAAQWERQARELDATGQQATGQQAQQPQTKKLQRSGGS